MIRYIHIFFFSVVIPILILVTGCDNIKRKETVIFYDDYRQLHHGPLGTSYGARTEYHFLPEAAPKSNWIISTFRYNLPQSWYVREIDNQRVIYQKGINNDSHWHPVIITGNEFWRNYIIRTSFKTEMISHRCGVVFRYKNDRCYYFFGVRNDTLVLMMVKNATAFHKPYEIILMQEKYHYDKNRFIHAEIKIDGDLIQAGVQGGPRFKVIDTIFDCGKTGFLADGPAAFGPIEILMEPHEKSFLDRAIAEKAKVEIQLQQNNPKMVLWKKISTDGFGIGRNLRFGDLNNDGLTDVLIGQVIHHGPKDRNSELSCLTAMTFDNEILWQTGSPDPWKDFLTNDVAFQIHDINNDGKNEVIYCRNFEMIIAEAATGKTILKTVTPKTPFGKPTPSGNNIFNRILGDCLYFCDLSGQGYDGDIILKDRYNYLWAFDSKLRLLWQGECNTGHYPFALDIDNDDRDELMMGYTLFDDDGSKIWTLDNILKDHADGIALIRFKDNQDIRLLCAASDEGMFFTDLHGKILKHHYIGHVQNPAVANFRDDLPGLESVSVNFWGNQGIVHLYDAEGDIYQEFEPNQYGSMCLPLNWTGRSEEYFVLNANVEEGGAYDGMGRKVLEFPDDGHPDMCYAVDDVTGDCRDEIIVWDPHELWIYTQDDNPKKGVLYKPLRNPLYNYSNYQTTVSLPGWN